MTITIGEDNNIGTLTTKAKEGVQTFVVKTKKLTKGETYPVQINYKLDNSLGSFSDNFKANYWRRITAHNSGFCTSVA